jgi:hypothetical protein
VAEVFFAKDTLDSGNVGLRARSSPPAVSGSPSELPQRAVAREGRACGETTSGRSCSWAWLGRRRAEPDDLARGRLRDRGAAGNGAVVVCNRLLVQRGHPISTGAARLATIMSSNYAVLGLAMAAAGILTDVFGARAVWIAAWGHLPRRRLRRARAHALASRHLRRGARCVRGELRVGRRRARQRERDRPPARRGRRAREWPPSASRPSSRRSTSAARDESRRPDRYACVESLRGAQGADARPARGRRTRR